MLCLIHSDSVYPFVVHCTMSERKFKIALYVKYKTWQCNFSFMSLAATTLTFILEAQPYNSQRLSYWEYYISYTPSISLGRALKFIAMRIIIPWFATHSVLLYHEFSSFCDFSVVSRWQTVKNKGHGLLGFYISNLSYTRTISTTRGSSILARLKCS